MLRKRNLHQRKHPFDAYPFEAFMSGSWQVVELMKIESGTVTLHFTDNQNLTMGKGPFSDLRIRSRKATISDCSCFLRPGIDICVLSASQSSDNSDKLSTNPVWWIDARINSIQRKPHKSECTCQYYVNFYVNQGSLGTEIRTLSKEVKVVGLNQISILQKLERNCCEDHHFRWDSSEDCPAVAQTKLLLGKFISDLSWLVATSVIKKVSFCVRSVQNKIVYQVLGRNGASSSLNSHMKLVNFKVKNGVLVPFVAEVDVSESETNRNSQELDSCDDDKVLAKSNDVEGLRRSKRRNTQPERYYGCGKVDDIDVGYYRTWPYKKAKRKDVDDKNSSPFNSSSREIEVNQSGKKLDSDTHHEEDVSLAIEQHFANFIEPKSDVQLLISDDGENVGDFSSGPSRSYNTPHSHRKSSFEVDDVDIETRWKGKSSSSNNGNQERKYCSTYSTKTKRDLGEEGGYKDRSFNATSHKEMLDEYLKEMNKFPTKQEPPVVNQWKELTNMVQKETEMSPRKNEEEISEMDMLWSEMEVALTTSFLEEAEGSNAANFTETVEVSKEACQHDNRLDEEIGIYCLKCGTVSTEIKDVVAPFIQNPVWLRGDKQCNEESNSEPNADEDDDFPSFWTHSSQDEPISKQNGNVWALIPDLKNKMLAHQKKAFQFLWQNIAGSMKPSHMESESKTRGGCVISHAPGAGKTFLIIAFLVSYLKLFPGKKPLIIAPKTTLCTWYKECIKWEISVPVYLIHGRGKMQGEFNQNSIIPPGIPRPSEDVKYVLDCLDKIHKWHSHPSVLVMGYTSFLAFIRDSKFKHRKYMAKALRESPGILILDEGHNPRSTKSRLRKGLMKVETELRILLSGTLFQNNFCEYFNSLCLARPKFVHEVLRELDPKYKKNSKIAEKAPHLLESRARKFFLDNIGNKIDSKVDDVRMEGLNILRKITNSFIDVYDSGSSESLPGLQIYTLLMNTTDMQNEMLQNLEQKMAESHGYPLEVELLITLGSIHPWLIKSAKFAEKFFTLKQLNQLENCKFELKIGSKVRFVLSLVFRVTKKEKVLIFCHNHAPVKYFIELFENFFRWKKDKEILVLNGELELFERGKVIDKFEDPNGASKILFASITACAEGISLTAASRVIFLDSEWNPSKTKQAIARAFRPGQRKMVYVYQLLAAGSLEENKYRRTTWKEWVSSMIFSEAFVKDPSQWQAFKIEDEILREMVEEDKSKAINMIMKIEKASTN